MLYIRPITSQKKLFLHVLKIDILSKITLVIIHAYDNPIKD